MPPNSQLPRVIDARFLATAQAPDQLPPPVMTEIAFAGRSNVGKSSLMNALMSRRNLVRTSSTPGCTRALGFFEARLDTQARLFLVDLPGYGYAARSKHERRAWGELLDKYLLERPTLRSVVLLVDVRRECEEEELSLLELLRTPVAHRPALAITVVATKLDQLPSSARQPRLRALSEQSKLRVLGVSVKESRTLDPLRALLFSPIPSDASARPGKPPDGTPSP